MTRLLFILLLCSPMFLLAQNPPALSNTIPDDPDFFDFVKFYIAENPTDTAEGSFTAKIKKMNRIWEKRLYPTGNANIAGMAITTYAKYFNQHGNADCTSGNWSCIDLTGVPIGTSNARGTRQFVKI